MHLPLVPQCNLDTTHRPDTLLPRLLCHLQGDMHHRREDMGHLQDHLWDNQGICLHQVSLDICRHQDSQDMVPHLDRLLCKVVGDFFCRNREPKF